MNEATKGLILSVVLALVSLAIYFMLFHKPKVYVIDNPSKQTLLVRLGETNYTISAGQKVKINLDKGEYPLLAKNELDSVLIDSTVTIGKTRAVINPTRANYFIFAMPYGIQENVDSIFTSQINTFEGKEYYGNLEITNAVVIDDFYYNLNEDFPSVVLKSENKALRRKIFSEDDFKQFYFETFE